MDTQVSINIYIRFFFKSRLNVVFLLSSAGKFSYQGTKRWIEEQLESGENTLLQDVSVVLCIDSIGKGNAINMHVSKPPKEFSSAQAILNVRTINF